uniref:Uncharacterized protein n=1 Tax=Eutreptiella gymnastica TaxID=73025 RepID=A0A7S4GIP6_9EUGL|mmetsp:Transcript_23616/g.40826  ORF Transcript_23616/g.40826 Transcript_23616/m.40826 type:complete len:148 (-) Transcript_23616:409-852(-)
MRVVRQKKKALSTLEELEKDASSDLGAEFHYDRNLLSEMRHGHGKHFKALKEILDADPDRKQRYKKQKEVEATMNVLRQNMMWDKESKSKTRAVQTLLTQRTRHTDPMGTGTLPFTPRMDVPTGGTPYVPTASMGAMHVLPPATSIS